MPIQPTFAPELMELLKTPTLCHAAQLQVVSLLAQSITGASNGSAEDSSKPGDITNLVVYLNTKYGITSVANLLSYLKRFDINPTQLYRVLQDTQIESIDTLFLSIALMGVIKGQNRALLNPDALKNCLGIMTELAKWRSSLTTPEAVRDYLHKTIPDAEERHLLNVLANTDINPTILASWIADNVDNADKLYELTAPQHEEALLQYCKHHGLSPDKLAESLNDNDVEYLCDLDAAFEVVQAIKDNNREDLLDPENMALHLHDCRDRSTWPNMSELLRKYVLKDDHTPSTANMRRISMSAAQLVAHRLDTSLCCPMGHPFRYKPAESGVYIYNPYFIPDILSLLLLSPIFQDNHKHKLNR